jgi:hypothetical protein
MIWKIPRGPKGEKRPADVTGDAVKVMRIARDEEELCLNLGDGVNQAANLASGTTSIPSRNLAPLTIFGNWF